MTGKFARLLEYALLPSGSVQLTAEEAAQYFALMNLDLFREAAPAGRKFEPKSGADISAGFSKAAAISGGKVTSLDLSDELDFWRQQFENKDARALELLAGEGFSLTNS